jgi:hypothetical protein
VDFAAVLAQLARFFEERRIRYAIAGAFALHAHGLSRATADLDFVVEDSAQSDLLAFLDGLGYERLHVSAGYSNHVHAEGSRGRLDFIYVDPDTADRLFQDARRTAILPRIEVPVPSPEHIAAMKVLAMKNDPSRTFRELADIQYLMTLPDVSTEKIRAQFDRHGMLDRFHELEKAIGRA